MKPQLRRIETTLEKIAQTNSVSNTVKKPSTNQKINSHQPSFAIHVKPLETNDNKTHLPSLPKLKPIQLSNHHHAANPALATGILKEIQTIVTSWQTELQQLQRQIQDLYLDGPIVDGWLESHARQPETAFSIPTKADQDRLMDYVEEMTDSDVSYQTPRAGYRLCGLDANGKLWSKPCPTEQVADVSVAIARYQKLRQLLSRKQYLEKRLSELSETLVILHSNLTES